MKKITKIEKDLYPKIYGYGSVEQLKKDLAESHDDLINWVHFIDRDGDIRFIPCTKEFFHWTRNNNRNEDRRSFRENLKNPISIDELLERYDFEYADPSYYENINQKKESEHNKYIWQHILKLPKKDRKLLTLYNFGLTDKEIGKRLNRSQSAIQAKKAKLLAFLKEKSIKFQKNR